MKRTLLFFIAVFVLVGCTTSQKSTATGGLAGAALGGIIGHQSGNAAAGAAIGGAVGTAGGLYVGDKLEKKFCPTGGEVYSEGTMYCPKHGVELKYRER